MRLKRNQIASILLLIFVSGSQLAPFSHYLFMAISDAYPPFQQSEAHRMGDEGVSRHHMAEGDFHAGHAVSQAKEVDDLVQGPHLFPVHEHVYCEYADLFATFAATGPDIVSESPVEFAEAITFEHEEVYVNTISAHTQSRAPPVQLS